MEDQGAWPRLVVAVVSGGKVWVTTAVEQRGISLRLLGFDAVTGRELVNVEVFQVVARGGDINPKNSWASPPPIVDGDRVYVHFGADGTAAVTTTGTVLWTQRFEHQSQPGAGGSPVVYGDLLIFSCDGSDAAFVVALDKQTGKVKWKTNRRFPADQAYTTPLVIRVGERDQLISVGAYRATAYDPLNGKEIWRVSYADGFSNVPRPVFAHGLVYIATGFQQQRLGGTYSASPVFAGGSIYFSAEQGVTTVIAAGKEFRRLATNRLDGGLLASMAVAGGSLFLRTDSHLYRIMETLR